MRAEALEFHIEGLRDDHEPIPEPSSLDAIMDDPGHRDAVAFLTEVAASRSCYPRIWSRRSTERLGMAPAFWPMLLG